MAGNCLSRRRFALITAGVCLVVAIRISAATSDRDLFLMGDQALRQGDLVSAALYLYAYVQRSPSSMQQDPRHATQVWDAINYARGQLQIAIDRVPVLEQEIANLSGVRGDLLRPGPPPAPRLDPPRPPQQPSESLVCRGGGSLRLNLFGEAFGVTGDRKSVV